MDESAPALLAQLRADGFELAAEGDRLRIRPVERVTPALRDRLARHKLALLAVLAPAAEFVTLLDGPIVPAPALLLVLDLECRGIALQTKDHTFSVPNDPRITDADRRGIARWHRHLGAIVEYSGPEVG